MDEITRGEVEEVEEEETVVVVQSLSHVWFFETSWIPACQARLLSPRVCPSSCPLSGWCHPTTSSSVIPLSSRLQSFPASGSFPVSRLFTSGAQSIGVSASASVLPMTIQGWSPLGWTDLISLQSKGLSRVFSSTTKEEVPKDKSGKRQNPTKIR